MRTIDRREEIFWECVAMRCKYESDKELSTDLLNAILDAMERYRNEDKDLKQPFKWERLSDD